MPSRRKDAVGFSHKEHALGTGSGDYTGGYMYCHCRPHKVEAGKLGRILLHVLITHLDTCLSAILHCTLLNSHFLVAFALCCSPLRG